MVRLNVLQLHLLTRPKREVQPAPVGTPIHGGKGVIPGAGLLPLSPEMGQN